MARFTLTATDEYSVGFTTWEAEGVTDTVDKIADVLFPGV